METYAQRLTRILYLLYGEHPERLPENDGAPRYGGPVGGETGE